MTDRDRLIELCDKKIDTMKFQNSDHWFDFTEKIKEIVDYLIANGVTVNEWISVEERLPPLFVSVLGYMPDAGDFPKVRECYFVGDGTAPFFPALGECITVTHWMPLPQAPKGVDNDKQ